MEKVFMLFVLFVTAESTHKHHPKFPKDLDSEVWPGFHKELCSSDSERHAIIEQSQCGEPKDVFVYLDSRPSFIEVRPSAVWVKRCVGLCDFSSYGSECVPLKTRIRKIPVRLYNIKVNKEVCSTYEVEEHLSCGCCAKGSEDCEPPRVFNPPEPEYEVEPV